MTTWEEFSAAEPTRATACSGSPSTRWCTTPLRDDQKALVIQTWWPGAPLKRVDRE